MPQSPLVAFIGIGNMGGPMAANLAAKGFSVTICNRTNSKSEAWLKVNAGTMVQMPSECTSAPIVCICVADEKDVEVVLFGEDGVVNGADKPLLIIDHTTTSSHFAKDTAAKLRQLGHDYVDAPVSGGTVGAQKGTLTTMCGGNASAIERATPILMAYTKNIFHMGPSGAGQLTKILNQICISATLRGVAEAIQIGSRSELNLTQVISVLGQGAAQSWQLENRGPWMLDDKFKGGGFAVRLIAKDLAIVLEQAKRDNVSLPITKAIKEQFDSLNSGESAQWDFSSIYTV